MTSLGLPAPVRKLRCLGRQLWRTFKWCPRNDNHLLLLDLRNFDISGKKLERLLDEVYITVNKNSIPDDPRSPNVTSGIRIGTAAVTTRGFGPAEMVQIAEWIKLVITDFENSAPAIRQGVEALCKKHPIYE